jgi:hypothetical protein
MFRKTNAKSTLEKQINKNKIDKSICNYLRLVFFIYFWYCEDLLIIPDLKYLHCDMNYLFNPYMSNKSYSSKEPIFRLFKPPLECQRPIYKLRVKPHSLLTSL